MAKIPIPGDQNLSKNLEFRIQIKPLELNIHPKVGRLRLKTMFKNFLNESRTTFKSRENVFFDQNMVKNDLSKLSKAGQNLTANVNFWGHLSAFSAENTSKSRPFKSKNNARTLSKEL